MEKRYILGIDAGGTKTHYALYDVQTGAAELLTGTCANHEGLAGSYAELETLLAENLQKLLARWQLKPQEIAGAGFGMAGVDTQRQHAIISDIFTCLGFPNFALANDGVLGIKAECESGVGVCAVNGSGFSVFGADSQGHTAQIGGLAYLTGDRGGGDYLLHQVVSTVYGSLFKDGAPTMMASRLLNLLNAADKNHLIEQLSEALEGAESKAFCRSVSQLLHTSALEGDAAACSILRSCGTEYARSILALLRQLPELKQQQPLEIVLVGSNFVKSECSLAADTLREVLAQNLPDLSFVIKPIRTQPVVGAVCWGCQTAGLTHVTHAAVSKAFFSK